jgi:hypothetical protein
MIAFIHLGKTAGSTFKNVLRRSFGHHHCDAIAVNRDMIFRDSDLNHAKRVHLGLRSLCSHHFKDPTHTLSAPLDYVTFLRIPLHRTASHYQHMIRDLDSGRRNNVPDLRDWLQEGGRNFQIRQISGGENVDDAMEIIRQKFLFVGLTEQYQESLNAFSALSPWPVNTQHEKRNISQSSSVKNQLLDDTELRGLIEEATEADQTLYQRVLNEIFPAQIELAVKLATESSSTRQPEHYFASRMYTNMVYRPSVKLLKKFTRPKVEPI